MSNTAIRIWFLSIFTIACFFVGCDTTRMPNGCFGCITTRGTMAKSHWRGPKPFMIRGGSSDEDTFAEDTDEEDGNEDGVENEVETRDDGANGDVVTTVMDISKRFAILVGKVTVITLSTVTRAVKAGLKGDDMSEEESEESGIASKVRKCLIRMWDAALNPEYSGENEIVDSLRVSKKEKTVTPVKIEDDANFDFGSYLAKEYGVLDEVENRTSVTGGTIGDALRDARSKARLLLVYIPSTRPSRGHSKYKKTSPDQIAIDSLLSKEVSEVAEKRAKKKSESGSFVLWGAKHGSPEAIVALQRLRVKQLGSKGDKRPVLLVAYPAQVISSSGVPKLVPKVVAQHHCNPPPSSESMATWLNALRKRHSKQYSAMILEAKELQLFKERKEGYKSSVVSDIQRKEEEKKAEEERLAKEKAEKDRLEELQLRREELRQSLPEEPDKDDADSMTIALRFYDGRSGQRRFTRDTPVNVLFNWVDGLYDMEREIIILSTMNGQKTFTWNESSDETLGQTGLGRMAGLRVTQKKAEESSQEEPEKAEEKAAKQQC